MPATLVVNQSFYRDPRTGRRVPESNKTKFIQWYRKKHKGKTPRREHWLYTVDGTPNEKRKGIQIKGRYHRIQIKVKMTGVEQILPMTGFTERHIRETFFKKKVFSNIWTNWGGVIRVTIGGVIPSKEIKGGRRIKEVLHVGFHREHWEMQEGRGRGGKRISGRELFRKWLVATVSSMLRRRGYRLSSPAESAGRVQRLRQELQALQGLTEFISQDKMGAHVNQLKWKAEAIQKQLKTKQIRGATIKIQKLV